MQSEPSKDSKTIKLRFSQPTRGLRIQENLGPGISFSPLFYLTNDRSVIAKLLGPEIAVGMGVHYAQDVLTSEAVMYLEGEVSQTAEALGEFGVDGFVHYCMEFLLSLWMVKDHAIDLLPAILRILPPDGKATHEVHWFGQINFDAVGKSHPVEFTSEEIRIACEYNLDWVQKLTREQNPTVATISPKQTQTNFESKSSRLLRFLCLLDRARTIPDLGVRLALFCSALECIFSTAKSEITHRVSERVAFFLESEGEKRKQMYQNVLEAYDIRSSVLHGSQIDSKKLQNLDRVCRQTDEILRRVFKKIVRVPDDFHRFTDTNSISEKSIKDYFEDMLFSNGNILHSPYSP